MTLHFSKYQCITNHPRQWYETSILRLWILWVRHSDRLSGDDMFLFWDVWTLTGKL